ncbi:MAG: hypothetical protein K8R53_04620, partial [Bacteroidales bacterium]|nr:hypothetical protein [Bacteroidales bacterium]
MKNSTLLFFAFIYVLLSDAQTGSITNVVAGQRTDGSKMVDISYDLTGQEPEYYILVKVSLDGGANYSKVYLLSGDWGSVGPGIGKSIVWNAGGEYPQIEVDNAVVLLYVEDIQNCGETFIYSNQEYETDSIGNQCWMSENLNVGIQIQNTTDQTDNNEIEKYCYDNDPVNCDAYGGLYKWDEAMKYATNSNIRGICPAGWHIPSDDEWKTLEGTVDSQFGVG